MKQHGCTKRPFLGIILVLVGLLLALKELNIIPGDVVSFLFTWKMLLVAIGIISLLNGNRTAGSVLLLIGAFFIIPDIVDVPMEIRRLYWPAALVFVGALILVGHNRISRRKIDFQNTGKNDQFEDFVIFGGREQMITTDNFKGGRTAAMFGGLEYDLTHCNPAPEGALIDVLTIFGGTTLNIPPDWVVRNNVTTIFGGVSDERSKNPMIQVNPDKVLVIKGLCLFGGVSIESKNYPVNK